MADDSQTTRTQIAVASIESLPGLVEANAKLIESMGKHVESIARADLLRAEASYQLARAEEIRTLIRQNAWAFQAIRQDWQQVWRDIQKANEQRANAYRLIGGVAVAEYGRAGAACYALLNRARGYDPGRLSLPLPHGTVRADDFFRNDDPASPVRPIPGSALRNAETLLDFSIKERLLTRIGSPANQHLAELLAATSDVIAEAVQKQLTRLQERAERIYQVWRPAEVLGAAKAEAKSH